MFPYFPGLWTQVAHTGFSGLFDYSKNVRKDNPTPAYSPVSGWRRLTALVEVNWARRVQAPMPQISGRNSQENYIIETCKEEGCAVSTQETAARRENGKWNILHLYRLLGPIAVRPAALKTRRSFSYTITTKNSCFWLCCCSLHNAKWIVGD
jgi:hypothetical protein